VPLTGGEAGPPAGAAGLDSRCNMSGCYLDEIRLSF
jgi:hypothetical protein